MDGLMVSKRSDKVLSDPDFEYSMTIYNRNVKKWVQNLQKVY